MFTTVRVYENRFMAIYQYNLVLPSLATPQVSVGRGLC